MPLCFKGSEGFESNASIQVRGAQRQTHRVFNALREREFQAFGNSSRPLDTEDQHHETTTQGLRVTQRK